MLKVLKVRESIETVINSIFFKIIVKVRLYFFSFQLSVPNNIGYELNRSNKTVLHCLIWLFDKINRKILIDSENVTVLAKILVRLIIRFFCIFFKWTKITIADHQQHKNSTVSGSIFISVTIIRIRKLNV